MAEKINLVCATDDKFAQHSAVMMCSVLKNTKAPSRLHFFVLEIDGPSEENKRKIMELVGGFGAGLTFVKIPEAFFSNLPVMDHLTRNTYSRLFFPNLQRDVRRFIYLDSDLVVEDDIAKLWAADMHGKVISAVYDAGINGWYSWFGFEKQHYFNAGVLVVDAQKFRRAGLMKKAMAFLVRHRSEVICGDQDALNYLLHGKWNELPLEWNVTGYFLKVTGAGRRDYAALMRTAVKAPKAIHFTPGPKPTDYLCENPFAKRYFYYLSFTPFRDFKVKNRTPLIVLYKNIRRFVPPLLRRAIVRIIKKSDWGV